MAPEMLLPVAPVLLQLSLSTPPLAPSVPALSRAGHCVALAKRGSKRTGGGGGFGAKRPQRPGGGGGFGALPPTLEEVVAGFKTRLPEDASVDCPCGRTDATGAPMSYEACCQPCHAGLTSGEGYPMESPVDCLRCRFSAFAYRLPLPIIATTHSDNRDYRTDRVAWARTLNRDGMFDDFRFVRLEVGKAEEGSNAREAFLSFSVALRRVSGTKDEDGMDDEMTVLERSRFVRTKEGGWLYANGEVTTTAAGYEGAVLNK